MTIKDRFRIALFNFFKPEIMSVVNQEIHPNNPYSGYIEVKGTTSTIAFEELKSEIMLDPLSDRDFMTQNPEFRIPFEFYYRDKIQIVKKQLANEVIKMIDVDTVDLLKSYSSSPRKVYFSIFVGKKK